MTFVSYSNLRYGHCRAFVTYPAPIRWATARRTRAQQMSVLSPATLKFLQTVLDDTWDSLRPYEKARTTKVEIAKRILDVAARGQRDPVRLRTEAVTGVITSSL